MDEAICVSLNANTFGKGMNPSLLSITLKSTLTQIRSVCKGPIYR